MGYGVGTYWYGDATTASNRDPDPVGALLIPPLPAKDTAEISPTKPSAVRFDSAIECETAAMVAKSEAMTVGPQSLNRFRNHRWSDARHLFVREGTVGDFVELRFPATGPKPAKLVLHATRSDDYGILRFSVNGRPIAAEVDLYADRPIPSGPISLGVFEPVGNVFNLRAEIICKNPKSRGTYFGLDCLVITPHKDNPL